LRTIDRQLWQLSRQILFIYASTPCSQWRVLAIFFILFIGAHLSKWTKRKGSRLPVVVGGSTNHRSRTEDFTQQANLNVFVQMGRVGEKLDIDFVVSTGDNFYDTGLTGVDDDAFEQSFTDIYTAKSLQKPWYLGKHC